MILKLRRGFEQGIKRCKIVNYGGQGQRNRFSNLSRYVKPDRKYEMCKSSSLFLILGMKFYIYLRLVKSVGDGDCVTRFGDGRVDVMTPWEA